MDTIDKVLNDECIIAHNKLREIHSNPPLTFDPELAITAQKWADEIARTGDMEHSPESMDGEVGENLASATLHGNAIFRGRAATDDWYSEIEFFDFGKENQYPCGHFSQVVWKSTERAGFGRSRHADGRQFIVGQYLPPGNFKNKWTLNIPPPKEDEKEDGSSSSSSSDEEKKELRPQTKGPRNKKDRLVGRSTRTRTENSVKTIIITEVYQTSSGEKYEVVNETVEGGNDGTGAGAKSSGASNKAQRNTSSKDADNNPPPSKQVIPVEEYRTNLIEAINKYRQKHQAKPLKRNQELEKMAQEWADYLSYCNVKPTCTYQYRNAPVGEFSEVILYSGDALSGNHVAKLWYSECEQLSYPFGQDPQEKAKICGKFSQLVWAGSEEIGVARATDKNGTTWFVCLFYPQGNIAGHYIENVLSAV